MVKVNTSKNRLDSYAQYVLDFLSSKTFLWITLGWFIVQAIYFALNIKFGIPPDETYHYRFSELFVLNNHWPFLTSQEGYYQLGEVLKTPFFLYHLLMSVPLSLVDNLSHGYIIIRLINVLMGLGSLLTVHKIAMHVSESKLVANIATFILSSTLMFTFISASINYDNLFILLSLLSVLLMILVIKKQSSLSLLLLIATLLAGSLTKITFLPILLVVSLITLFYLIPHYRIYLNDFQILFKDKQKRSGIVITLLILVLLATLSFTKYVLNVSEYGSPTPGCTQVLTHEQCATNSVFVRNEHIRNHDRRAADMTKMVYVATWVETMADRTYGVFLSRGTIQVDTKPLYLVIAVLVGGLLLAVRHWKPTEKYMTIIAIVALFYVAILIIKNYSEYLMTGRASLAVQGRYVLGALPLVYIVAIHYYQKSFASKPVVLSIFLIILIILFAYLSLPYFLLNASPGLFV